MASISNQPNGYKTIQFVGTEGKRRSIRLGRMSRKAATAFKVKVEHLASASIAGHPLDEETSRWLASLDDGMVDRLASVGLTSPRPSTRLGEFLEKYLTTRRDLKPSSVRKLGQTKVKLLAFFDTSTPLRAITADQAASNESLGLVGMRERAVSLGGELTVRPQDHGGTVVALRLPHSDGTEPTR